MTQPITSSTTSRQTHRRRPRLRDPRRGSPPRLWRSRSDTDTPRGRTPARRFAISVAVVCLVGLLLVGSASLGRWFQGSGAADRADTSRPISSVLPTLEPQTRNTQLSVVPAEEKPSRGENLSSSKPRAEEAL